MKKARDPIENLRIAAPCPVSWEGMVGDERVRHCTQCSLNVYNFAEMTRDEVRELLMRTEGRLCGRLYRRADGTLLTRDCPTGLRALRRRASRVAAALVTALLALPSFAFGRTGKKPRFVEPQRSEVKLEIERVAAPQPAVLRGVIIDETGMPIPGVTIMVRDEASQHSKFAFTNENGVFTVADLNDGLYRIDAMIHGLRPAVVEHLPLRADEATHENVTFCLERVETVTVGIIAMVPQTTTFGDGITVSTTFPQDFINKLPR